MVPLIWLLSFPKSTALKIEEYGIQNLLPPQNLYQKMLQKNAVGSLADMIVLEECSRAKHSKRC